MNCAVGFMDRELCLAMLLNNTTYDKEMTTILPTLGGKRDIIEIHLTDGLLRFRFFIFSFALKSFPCGCVG